MIQVTLTTDVQQLLSTYNAHDLTLYTERQESC